MSDETLRIILDLIRTSPALAVATVMCLLLWKLYPEARGFFMRRAEVAEQREERKAKESRERAKREATYDAFMASLKPLIDGFSSVVENNTKTMQQLAKESERLQDKVECSFSEITANQTKHLEKITEVATIVKNKR